MLVIAVPALLIMGGLVTLAGTQPPFLSKRAVERHLERTVGTDVPGMQYVVVSSDEVLLDYAGGWADVAGREAMTSDHTMMAFSMTKTLTAVAVLQLVEEGKLGLEDKVDAYLPDIPYTGQGITIRQLLAHTSGIPNPIPLRWVHLASKTGTFDEEAALRKVLARNPELRREPGDAYGYSNIGYWLLGKVIEVVTSDTYVDHMRSKVLAPLGLNPPALGYVVPDSGHAGGYIARYSFTNLMKTFLTDDRFWGDYEGNWLRVEDHHLNGPAFGGLVGAANAFGTFLQDQLRPDSVLLGSQGLEMLYSSQSTSAGVPVPMTLGWHVAQTEDGARYFFKEGGGGGFHAEMRLYPEHGVGTVVMVNDTDFGSTEFLDRVDHAFLSTAQETRR